jgi:hypothetical protein
MVEDTASFEDWRPVDRRAEGAVVGAVVSAVNVIRRPWMCILQSWAGAST